MGDPADGVGRECSGDGDGNGISLQMREKVIIDTDPGIDDAMTILMAFRSPELEIVGITTIFGNAFADVATRNGLLLCEMAGYPNVPVAEGHHEPLKGGKPKIPEFIHGSDGLGNTFLPLPNGKKIEKTASEFLVETVSKNPGGISILALGPLTNLALAIKRDSSFASKVKKIVILGGAFFSSGNINPAAEANVKKYQSLLLQHYNGFNRRFVLTMIIWLQVYGDPEAADIVFTCGADIIVVGINITTQVQLLDSQLQLLRSSKGKHAQFISDSCKFYRDWHVQSDGVHGIFLHDPVSFMALLRPDLFTFKRGVVRVETQGICTGHTLMDQGLKIWNSSHPWTGYSPISVAWTVDVPAVIDVIMERLMKP